MKLDKSFSKAATEVLEILNYVEDEEFNKILNNNKEYAMEYYYKELGVTTRWVYEVRYTNDNIVEIHINKISSENQEYQNMDWL